MALDAMVIDVTSKRIHLRDPWLNPPNDQSNAENMTALMQTYPSP